MAVEAAVEVVVEADAVEEVVGVAVIEVKETVVVVVVVEAVDPIEAVVLETEVVVVEIEVAVVAIEVAAVEEVAEAVEQVQERSFLLAEAFQLVVVGSLNSVMTLKIVPVIEERVAMAAEAQDEIILVVIEITRSKRNLPETATEVIERT